ncbi:hypothetical protein [Comamonas testosteroni]|uniref:hypothetical protein n=1 Tax=Comamonas testosteroni TaxID=285 RepID=UPI0026F0EBDC|nr:hypothetical protein [Comamonas testosteroni]
MGSDVNKHGLRRYVPSDVRRAIRQRCGFGCVICGFGFYDYEHFDPDFSEAKIHNPDGMTLLCSQCNQKRARGRLSVATVAKANQNPKCRQQGFASEFFDFGINPIAIVLASNRFYDCKHVLVINDVPILSLNPPTQPGESFRISGIFTDELGRIALTIRDNEWKARLLNWDVECEGPNILVRTDLGKIALHLFMDPEASRLTIKRIEMQYESVRLHGDETTLQFSINGQQWSSISSNSIESCYCGISIDAGPKSANEPFFEL